MRLMSQAHVPSLLQCTLTEHHRVLPCVQGDNAPGLLLADMQCLPGMEGGPVMSACGKLLGVLCQPLCSQSFQAEANPSCCS